MKLRIKVHNIEIEFKDSDSENGYPRIVTTDKYKDITKSERLVEVIKELTQEAVKAYNETNN